MERSLGGSFEVLEEAWGVLGGLQEVLGSLGAALVFFVAVSGGCSTAEK